jgi:hypothetical protein
MNTGNIGRGGGPKENERLADNDDDPAGSAKRHEAEAAAEQAITAELDRHAEEGERMTVTVESVMALIAQVRETLCGDDEIRAFVAAIPQRRLEEWADVAEWLTRLGGRLRLDLDRRLEINTAA